MIMPIAAIALATGAIKNLASIAAVIKGGMVRMKNPGERRNARRRMEDLRQREPVLDGHFEESLKWAPEEKGCKLEALR
jgi:hypothetical protein